MKSADYLKSSIIAIILGVIYYPALAEFWFQWNKPETYYSHGLLIPIASAFFLWIKRKELSEIKIKPSKWGMVLMALAVLMNLFGILVKLYFLSGYSLIIMLIGMVVFLFGVNMLKETLFAILYLFFMIPLPLVVMSNLIIKMKLFAGEMATIILNRIGLFAVRDGSIIRMANSYLEIEAPCSGLRSLIALMAFGAAFAYLTKNSLVRKWVLFASALPIAIAANVLRIVLLGWVSEIYGMKAAQGWVHDFSGFLLFFIAAVGMLAVNSLLRTTQIGTDVLKPRR